MLYAVEGLRYQGEFGRATELLEKARGHSQPTIWLRHAAELAFARGDLVKARGLWGQVVDVEPLAEDAHRALAAFHRRHRRTRQGPGAPAQDVRRFPHHLGLNRLLLDWMRDDGPAAQEPVIRRLVDSHPSDAWARRELALDLAELGRLDEAFAELDVGASLEPASVALCCVKAAAFDSGQSHRGGQGCLSRGHPAVG